MCCVGWLEVYILFLLYISTNNCIIFDIFLYDIAWSTMGLFFCLVRPWFFVLCLKKNTKRGSFFFVGFLLVYNIEFWLINRKFCERLLFEDIIIIVHLNLKFNIYCKPRIAKRVKVVVVVVVVLFLINSVEVEFKLK